MEAGGRLDEQQLPLLWAQATDADEPERIRRGRRGGIDERSVDTAVHLLELAPVLGRREQHALALHIATDAHGHHRCRYLLSESPLIGGKQLQAVDRHAERNA